jgi:hypothetical protein
LWYSVFIQASKALKSSVVLIPPQNLPAKRIYRLSDSMDRQHAVYVAQYTRHALFLPYLSASWPAKAPLRAAEMKPVA